MSRYCDVGHFSDKKFGEFHNKLSNCHKYIHGLGVGTTGTFKGLKYYKKFSGNIIEGGFSSNLVFF